MTNKSEITVVGGGAWGCGIASVLAANNHQVRIFTNDENFTRPINENHETPRLPGINLSDKIKAYTDLAPTLDGAKFLFIVIPSDVVDEVLERIKKEGIDQDVTIIICSKGIDNKHYKLFGKIIEEIFPNIEYAVLSGPNFAVEVAEGLPTVTNIASKNNNTAQKVVQLLKNDYFLPVASDDIVTTQIAGVIKNILAIGCGLIVGLELGENTRAALMVKGINEITLLSTKLGGKKESLFSPAGFGDIFLTCSSNKSRNFSLGEKVGQGQKASDLLADIDMVYEGAKSVRPILALAKRHDVKLELCQMISDILYSDVKDIKELIKKSVL